MKTITIAQLNEFFNDTTFINVFANAAFRWLDEREYEDIADYKPYFKNLVLERFGIEDITMTTRPFGFKFNCNLLKDGVTTSRVVIFKAKANGEISYIAKSK